MPTPTISNHGPRTTLTNNGWQVLDADPGENNTYSTNNQGGESSGAYLITATFAREYGFNNAVYVNDITNNGSSIDGINNTLGAPNAFNALDKITFPLNYFVNESPFTTEDLRFRVRLLMPGIADAGLSSFITLLDHTITSDDAVTLDNGEQLAAFVNTTVSLDADSPELIAYNAITNPSLRQINLELRVSDNSEGSDFRIERPIAEYVTYPHGSNINSTIVVKNINVLQNLIHKENRVGCIDFANKRCALGKLTFSGNSPIGAIRSVGKTSAAITDDFNTGANGGGGIFSLDGQGSLAFDTSSPIGVSFPSSSISPFSNQVILSECWVKPTAGSYVTNHRTIFQLTSGDPVGDSHYEFMLARNSVDLGGSDALRITFSAGNTGHQTIDVNAVTLPFDVWAQIGASMSFNSALGTWIFRFYKDGVFKDEIAGSTTNHTNTFNEAHIAVNGRYDNITDATNSKFIGKISLINLYKGILSDSDIDSIIDNNYKSLKHRFR